MTRTGFSSSADKPATQGNHEPRHAASRARLIARAAYSMLALLVAFALAACGGTPTLSQQTASYTIKVTLDTLAIGDRTATVEVSDQAGQPVNADQVVLTPTMLSMGMASPEAIAQPSGAGRYTSDKILLSMTGDWELDVTVKAGNSSETARFNLTVPTQ